MIWAILKIVEILSRVEKIGLSIFFWLYVVERREDKINRLGI